MDLPGLVGQLLDLEPGHPVTVEPTSSPVAFKIDAGNVQVIAKRPRPDRPGSALAEAAAYRTAHAHGAQVPRVLATRSEPELIVLELVQGFSLWSRHRPEHADRTAWRSAGTDLRAIHEARLPGFGPLTIAAETLRGEADAWSPLVAFPRDTGIGRLVDAGLLVSSQVAGLLRRYDEYEHALVCTDGRLLHGDLEGGHVMVDARAAYQGMIDFGQAQAGDPAGTWPG